jgi:hypothetical protein
MGEKDVLVAEYFLDETMFGEFLAKQ